jgi:hypothetical protein
LSSKLEVEGVDLKLLTVKKKINLLWNFT